MGDTPGQSAFRLILSVMVAMTLVGALVGGVVLITREHTGDRPQLVQFAIGSGPGTVTLRGMSEVGDRPFTEPVAVDLAIDPVRLALPPLNALAAETISRRGSSADRLVANVLAHRLIELRDSGAVMDLAQIRQISELSLGTSGSVSDLVDADRDGFDDDGRFTVTALDGSAVCITFGERRDLATALSQSIDPIDDASATGIDWTTHGPCTGSSQPPAGSEIRVGTTPGTYGGVRNGDVCDADLLVTQLMRTPALAASWSVVQSIEVDFIPVFVASLTPVILLRDTLVTDHGFENGWIHAGQVVLQRGTAVMVDRTGQPRARCLSGSPLRRPQGPVASGIEVVGEPWRGFSLDSVSDIPSAERATNRLVLVDIRSGRPLIRETGDTGGLSGLAGPLVSALGG